MFFSAVAALSLGVALLSHPVRAEVHDITVGSSNGTLLFNPEAIFAAVGDQIVFHFQQKNHTVTQSSLTAPCSAKEGGFDSGFMPVPANQTDSFPTYTITVNDTAPIWAYCAQAATTANSHCGKGMIFSANCGPEGAANSFTNFKKEALAIGAQLAAAASASSAAYPAASSAAPATGVATAAYGGVTIAPAPAASTVTQTVTLASSTWTTTYASYPNSPAATPASLTGNIIKVIVGGNSTLTFDPPHVSAQPRDQIVFEFQTKNHTVTQSAFADPCRRFTDATTGQLGFDSGFFPVANGTTDFPTFTLTVNDTAPIWAYCRQKTPASHCGTGMVFSINSDETSLRSFSAFQNLAKQLNGTAAAFVNGSSSASGAAPSSTGAADSGAGMLRVGGVTVVLGAVAAAFIAVL